MTDTELNFESIDRVLGPTREQEVVSIIRNDAGKILIITKNGYPEGVYRFPGGGMEKGETPTEALVREAKEEFNRDIEVVKKLGNIKVLIKDKENIRNWESHIFLIKPQKPLVLSEDGEHVDHRWISPSELAVYIESMKKIGGYGKDGASFKDWASLRVLPLEFVYRELKEY